MIAVEAGWENSVNVEYDVRGKVAEVHDLKFLHMRESVNPAKCRHIVCLQEEDPSINIG